MDVTVINELRRSARSASIHAFLAVRRIKLALTIVATCGVLVALLGTYQTVLPSLGARGHAIVPLWRLLIMSPAVLPVMAIRSRLADLEVTSTRRLNRYQRAYLFGMGLVCLLIYLGIAAITLPWPVLATSAPMPLSLS